MLLVILGIGLVCLTIGIIFYSIQSDDRNKPFRHWIYNEGWPYCGLNAVGAAVIIIALIAALVVCIDVSREKAIDNQIAIYQEENSVIENTVAGIVNNYQDYEQTTFENIKPDEIMVAVNLYPELKSNELVSKQIEIHSENNTAIKELKCKKAELSIYKWWLYFGG